MWKKCKPRWKTKLLHYYLNLPLSYKISVSFRPNTSPFLLFSMFLLLKTLNISEKFAKLQNLGNLTNHIYSTIVLSFRHLPHVDLLYYKFTSQLYLHACYKYHLKTALNKTQITLLWLDIKTQDFNIYMTVLLKLSFRLMKCYCKKTICLNLSKIKTTLKCQHLM